MAGLVLSGDTLYGTTYAGGSFYSGTAFAVSTDGTVFQPVYDFDQVNGESPEGDLILSGNTLYGTTVYGGNTNSGTVFKVNTNGTGIRVLHAFTRPADPYLTNRDGFAPFARLVLSGNTLYGTASGGGSSGAGTLFAVNTDGTGFRLLHSFTGGSEGVSPRAGVILSGNTLYGAGGSLFAVNTNGTAFTVLRTNISSTGALVLSGNTLYGTKENGGSSGNGTVFAVDTDGTGFTTLYSFTATSTNSSGINTNSDGAHPLAGLVLSGNTLYGTAYRGGLSGDGTVFSLLVLPQLTITPSGANLILTWPIKAAGFTLQSTTDISPPALWTPVSPDPVVINGQNTVTNPISGKQKFYRLMQ